MKTYRCTRNKLYAYHDCIGQKNLSARQGHYVEAEDEHEARKEMCESFPFDFGDFTVTLWQVDGDDVQPFTGEAP